MSKIDNAANRWADAQDNIGKILGDNTRRDALHFAVAPVIASHSLTPGQHIGLTQDGTATSASGFGETKPIGIVDPFLTAQVSTGQRFWLFLYPNTITSLRHVWDHPDFAGEIEPSPSKEASEAWLREFARTADCPDYDTLITAALGGKISRVDGYGHPYENDGEYLLFRGRNAHGDIPAAFWDHLEVVAGIKIPDWSRATKFSCSC